MQSSPIVIVSTTLLLWSNILKCSYFDYMVKQIQGLPGWLSVKNPSANAGDMGLIPGSGRSPEGGNSSPLQHSSLENPMDRGTWRAAVHGVTELGMTYQLNNSNNYSEVKK